MNHPDFIRELEKKGFFWKAAAGVVPFVLLLFAWLLFAAPPETIPCPDCTGNPVCAACDYIKRCTLGSNLCPICLHNTKEKRFFIAPVCKAHHRIPANPGRKLCSHCHGAFDRFDVNGNPISDIIQRLRGTEIHCRHCAEGWIPCAKCGGTGIVPNPKRKKAN